MTKLLLPCRIDNLRKLSSIVATKDDDMTVVAIDQSRFVWEDIRPCIFENDPATRMMSGVARRMMFCLYTFAKRYRRLFRVRAYIFDLPSTTAKFKWTEDKTDDHDVTIEQSTTYNRMFYEREISFRLKRKLKCHQVDIILILPPVHDPIQYAWEERVILLEHDKIRAQSVAGFYSTLGGGYFMTRRLQTAIALAREQQRLALLLGHKEMYYKCTINQAYNHIYAGRFQQARKVILQVWIALAHEKHFDEKLVLQNMCRSAMFFRKRVKEATRHMPPAVDGKAARLVDDFSRIRVVEDQSSHNDLAVVSLPLKPRLA